MSVSQWGSDHNKMKRNCMPLTFLEEKGVMNNFIALGYQNSFCT